MREAVRPLVPVLEEFKKNQGLSLMFIHVGPEESDQALIRLKINLLLERFTEQPLIPSSHEH